MTIDISWVAVIALLVMGLGFIIGGSNVNDKKAVGCLTYAEDVEKCREYIK